MRLPGLGSAVLALFSVSTRHACPRGVTAPGKGPVHSVNGTFLSLEQGQGPGRFPWTLLVKRMESSAPQLREGPPQDHMLVHGRGQSSGLLAEAAEVCLLLPPPQFGIQGGESVAFTRRHQETISKVRWGRPAMQEGLQLWGLMET